jgi:hypothetical protein
VIEFRQDFATISAGNGQMNVVLPHLQECVAQIRGEFLPDPDDRLIMMTKRLDQRIDRGNKVRALLSQAGVLPEKVIEHVND